MSDPQRPPGLQPTRLLRPWDFPGRRTGVGCHCLLHLSGSIVVLIATSSKSAYTICCTSQVCCSQSPCPCSRSLLTRASAGDTQTLRGRSCSVSCEGHYSLPSVTSEHLWQVWDFVSNVIVPLLPSCWGFSFALGHGVSFFGGIQHSPVNGLFSI